MVGSLQRAHSLAANSEYDKKLEVGEPPDDLLKQAVYFQRIPQTLRQDVEELLLRATTTLSDFVWMWEVAFKERMDRVAATVLNEMRYCQSSGRGSMFADCQSMVSILHYFDDWAMNVLMRHLEELKSDTGSDDTLYHHVVNIFDMLRCDLGPLQLREEDEQKLELLRSFYERKYPVRRALLGLPVSRLNARQRMTEGMRRAHVDVLDGKEEADS